MTNGNEIDLLLERQRTLFPIEIKTSRTWNKGFLKQIKYFQKEIPTAKKGTVIYAGEDLLDFGHQKAIAFDSEHIFSGNG